MDFATNLKRICTERGTSPTALLKSMGVATSKVALWNGGSLPKQEMLVRLAKELNCSVMDFFADEDTIHTTTKWCKSEPLLLCEERLRICERNRGHGISRDLSSVLLHFWDFKHIPWMDDRS